MIKKQHVASTRTISLEPVELALLNKQVMDNCVRTSKYNVFTFLPLNLLEQFKKPANIYFVVIMCMQMIDVISISNG